MLKKTIVALALFLTLGQMLNSPATAYNESAVGELVGLRTEGSGLVLGGNWAIDAVTQSFGWTITDLGTGMWRYEYTLTNFSSPEAGHLILDLSDGCIPGNPGCVIGVPALMEFKTFGPAKSNPGFPAGASITGVKIEATDEPLSVISFTSSHAPVYGDLYVKGGHDSYAYNAGLSDHASADPTNFIARPGMLAVPEPAVLFLFGFGLFFLAAAHRRNTRR